MAACSIRRFGQQVCGNGSCWADVNYVPMETWRRVGLGLSLVNLAIWLTVGLAWWKLMGLW